MVSEAYSFYTASVHSYPRSKSKHALAYESHLLLAATDLNGQDHLVPREASIGTFWTTDLESLPASGLCFTVLLNPAVWIRNVGVGVEDVKLSRKRWLLTMKLLMVKRGRQTRPPEIALATSFY